jgi:dTDP-4-dehydrorhamnose reductase
VKIIIIGSNGQLGSELSSLLGQKNKLVPLTHQQIEIEKLDPARKLLAGLNPDIIINTAAYHHVLKCEQNPELSFAVNALGSWNLARIAAELDCKLVHYSTDYVFDGLKKSPYSEDDKPNPLNVYAVSKLAGENFVQNYCEKYFILRVSGIYGKVPCRAKGGNFIMTMIKAAAEREVVKVVADEILTPTPVEQIAGHTEDLIHTDAYGLYHLTCQGQCSWYEFASAIFRILKIKTPLQACQSSEFPAAAGASVQRPLYSVLENKNLQALQMDHFTEWPQALQQFLTRQYM